jgi:hypothetical protein
VAAARLAAAALFLAGCAGAARPDASAPSPGAHARWGDPPRIAVEIDVSFATNLFHWVDNLAGTSLGKNRDTYRRHWRQMVGPLDDEDRAALDAFRRARRWIPADVPAWDLHPGCSPDRSGLSTRERLSAAAMKASDVDDLLRRASGVVPPREVARLSHALGRFEPRFREELWPRSAYLGSFREDLERFLEAPPTRHVFEMIVSFLEARPDPSNPARISLVAILEHGPTHAEAAGRHLLLEIRPRDRGRNQTQVLFHEFAHYLFRSLPAADRARIAGSFLTEGAAGALAWLLLQEALPTALGQGVAQVRLAPVGFRAGDPWYHREPVDAYAHALFPVVQRALANRRTLTDTFPAGALTALAASPASRAPPVDHIGLAALAAPARRFPSLRRLAEPIDFGSPFEVDLDRADAADFLSRFGCLPLVVLATEDDWPGLRLPGADRGALPAGILPLRAGVAGMVVPARRPSGSMALFLVAATPEGLNAVVDALLAMKRWPATPVEVVG